MQQRVHETVIPWRFPLERGAPDASLYALTSCPPSSSALLLATLLLCALQAVYRPRSAASRRRRASSEKSAVPPLLLLLLLYGCSRVGERKAESDKGVDPPQERALFFYFSPFSQYLPARGDRKETTTTETAVG